MRPGRAVVMMIALASALPATASGTAVGPSDQTLVFYNARIALREGKPEEALKLWLLRNSLAQRGQPGTDDADFHSVVWAALGEQGLCPDGFPDDDGGAGLWPLSLHNWLVLSLSKGPPPAALPPWDVFPTGRQQRLVSLEDVLSAEELRSVAFFRTGCLRPRLALLGLKNGPAFDLSDRLNVGLLMRELLERSRQTLAREKVESLAAIDARIFDLDLALAALQGQRLRREGEDAVQQARFLGVSKQGAEALRSKVARWPEDSKQAAFLRKSLTWTPEDWLNLSEKRRLSLFAQARPLATDEDARDRLELGIIDALVARGAGREVELWIGFLDAEGSPALRKALSAGERGRRLIELEPESGFRERAVVALHRGVGFLETGSLQDALRSFAYALRHSEESRESEVTRALARRWLSYVLSRFRTDSEVLATLKALVPRLDYNSVIEDLVWRAAFRADLESFDRITASAHHGGSFDALTRELRPLAKGNPGELATVLRDGAKDGPHAVLRFVRRLLGNLETEDGEVRQANVPTLELLLRILDGIRAAADEKGSLTRISEELMGRTQAILDGLQRFDRSEEGRARAMSPQRETFAGAIHLAPADPLPWPFSIPEPEAPSAFVPLKLQPLEWRDPKGALVFGWRISE